MKTEMKEIVVCKNCGNPVKKNASTYCSNKCQQDFKYKTLILAWLDGQQLTLKTIRRFLLEESKNVCAICGLDKWNGKPMPLVLDHIDGNSDNNTRENLRMICNNCDALTDTYKGKNRGKGRATRMERYRQGKSY